MKTTPPPKNYALACWWLTYRVPVECAAVEPHVGEATNRARITIAQLLDFRTTWPKPWDRMLAKRAVRLAYLHEHGKQPPDGWAPLPGDGRSRNVPVLARKRRAIAAHKLECSLPPSQRPTKVVRSPAIPKTEILGESPHGKAARPSESLRALLATVRRLEAAQRRYRRFER